jgi:NTP pyrophosphatase (non-canonical NTP hydrolase)
MTVPPIPGIASGQLTNLHALASFLNAQLTAHRRAGIDDDLGREASMWKVGEEQGELHGAHSRFRGTSRRPGPYHDLEAEAADVLLAVGVYAVQAGLGPDCLALARLNPDAVVPGKFFTAADGELHLLAAAAGRMAEAHYAAAGQASLRRLADAVAEVADRLCDYAVQAGIDLRTAAAAKAQVIVGRGWREEDMTAGERPGTAAVSLTAVAGPAAGEAR